MAACGDAVEPTEAIDRAEQAADPPACNTLKFHVSEFAQKSATEALDKAKSTLQLQCVGANATCVRDDATLEVIDLSLGRGFLTGFNGRGKEHAIEGGEHKYYGKCKVGGAGAAGSSSSSGATSSGGDGAGGSPSSSSATTGSGGDGGASGGDDAGGAAGEALTFDEQRVPLEP